MTVWPLIVHISIVQSLWCPEPRPDNAEPEPLPMTGAQLHALTDKAIPDGSPESLIREFW